ncbi:MAG: hypothetical protein KH366_23850 [Clostridiaceae bacterium]|nr:hypothetical protein [Clostridiaceae bacterium]
MWLKQLFIENNIDFDKRCRSRIMIGALFAALGAVAVVLSFASDYLPVMYLEPGYRESISAFYIGTGCGLIGAGIMTVINNIRYLKKPELKKKRKIYETDERNRMIGLRCWAYTGYTMMLGLYIGILAGGFISLTVLKTLLAVLAVYAVILGIFKIILQRVM